MQDRHLRIACCCAGGGVCITANHINNREHLFSGGLIFRKEVMKMDIGVSTACLYPLETEKALYELAERGVKNVEIFVNSIDELEGQVLVELRRIIGEYGMNVISMHPFSSPMETLFLFGDYPRRTEYLIDIYKRYFEVMAEIGAGVFVLHGAILSSKVPDEGTWNVICVCSASQKNSVLRWHRKTSATARAAV